MSVAFTRVAEDKATVSWQFRPFKWASNSIRTTERIRPTMLNERIVTEQKRMNFAACHEIVLFEDSQKLARVMDQDQFWLIKNRKIFEIELKYLGRQSRNIVLFSVFSFNSNRCCNASERIVDTNYCRLKSKESGIDCSMVDGNRRAVASPVDKLGVDSPSIRSAADREK